MEVTVSGETIVSNINRRKGSDAHVKKMVVYITSSSPRNRASGRSCANRTKPYFSAALGDERRPFRTSKTNLLRRGWTSFAGIPKDWRRAGRSRNFAHRPTSSSTQAGMLSGSIWGLQVLASLRPGAFHRPEFHFCGCPCVLLLLLCRCRRNVSPVVFNH